VVLDLPTVRLGSPLASLVQPEVSAAVALLFAPIALRERSQLAERQAVPSVCPEHFQMHRDLQPAINARRDRINRTPKRASAFTTNRVPRVTLSGRRRAIHVVPELFQRAGAQSAQIARQAILARDKRLVASMLHLAALYPRLAHRDLYRVQPAVS